MAETLRERQRRQTRALVQDAALELFLIDGYLATPVTAIARRANVAERTVYNLFETKGALLLAIMRDRIGGSGPESVQARHEAMTELDDPVGIIEQLAAATRDIIDRALPLVRVAHEASVVDPDVATRWEEQEKVRFHDQAHVLHALRDRGFLRTDVPFDFLQRGLWLLAGPEPAIKALDAGWDVDEYSRWLVETLTGLLVDRNALPTHGG